MSTDHNWLIILALSSALSGMAIWIGRILIKTLNNSTKVIERNTTTFENLQRTIVESTRKK